ncbi:methyltransferase domain-containing protein [Muricauda sp. TY007]|uniref:class I SAM-dependent methyltransferase n=1 Tax=Allomuricauda sp. TY007 TaxID=2683200 RepID=UPI0013BF87AE|nr:MULTISPECIES: class I SAM-dependent methyltransferase [unclassified Allomuricauda]MBA4746057.1 class I SAM-dependent methyltransferase [Allomuricauda sp.]NDV16387.1 methyltransferase domain-containing protein [Muricauda sp. TY007]
MADVFGRALLDYQKGDYTEDIKTYSSLDEEDVIPVPYLFREFDEMPKIEQKALQLARGKVLDIGAGAGSHALYLQNKGFDVTALDNSEGCIAVCKERGIRSTVVSDVLDYANERYDTLLLLMNGIGLAGKLNNLSRFLLHLASLLQPNGQILLDSSDIVYMFEQDEDGGYWIPNDGTYYGEVVFEMEYKGQKGKAFDWVYVDFDTLQNASESNGLDCELVISGEHFDYLAKLTLKK